MLICVGVFECIVDSKDDIGKVKKREREESREERERRYDQ